MKVCKFGGTSVGTVERMKHVATLIKDATPKIVVLSATAGTTNHLEEIAANLFNREIEQAHDRITRLEFQFIEFANGLLTDEKLKREAIDYILDRFQQLWKFTKDSFTSVEVHQQDFRHFCQVPYPPLPAGILQSGRICGYRRLHSFIEYHLRTTPICPCIGRRPHDHRLRGGQHAMGICRV